jgi:2-amino-4-hydroxy-6-hydroxymethyldihydropteridine diphosphokinase
MAVKKKITSPYGNRQPQRLQPKRGAILYYLGLGSNLGDRSAHIEKAIAFLQGCGRVVKRSSIYETTPVGMPESGLFLDMVVVLESTLSPLALLGKCKGYETSQGRDLRNSHYRDRVIDIDILLAGDLVMAALELSIPHPRLTERGFVLVPLFEIAPKLIHPLEKVTVARLLSRLQGGEKIRRLG